MIRTTCTMLALAAIAVAQNQVQNPVQSTVAVTTMEPVPAEPATVQPASSPAPITPNAIDLVICLDTSGSMSGLINAARQNLWAVVNDLATLKPQPELRVALLTFGSPAYGADTGFVAVQTGLTNDLDLVSQKLFALTTNGGDEYVGRVVRRALDDLDWAPHPKALKLMFVAGNEAATQDPEFDAFAQSRAAINAGVLVNTIYCGNLQHQDAAAWQQVAKAADGQFASIDKDQAIVIETPFDKQLTELSTALNKTYVPYGKNRAACASNQWAQDSNAATMNTAAAAQRAQSKASSLYCNPMWDLVDALKDPKFELAKVEKKELPEDLRKLTTPELKAHVETMQAKREALQKKVAEIGKQRDAFVVEERKKLLKKGDKAFEDAVLESVRAQARSRGFERKVEEQATVEAKPAAKPTEKPQAKPAGPFEEIIRDAAKGYSKFARVTGSPLTAPTDCRRPPGPFARVSQASKAHGEKLYVLYARHADGTKYIEKDQPAKVGQTLVKESWERVDGLRIGKTEADKCYPGGLSMTDGGLRYHAGASNGLFVMHKLANDTAGTDQGWVYGTIDPQGRVTAAGKVASCIKCHQDADNDRRFGLD